jgi:hypothetical protein
MDELMYIQVIGWRMDGWMDGMEGGMGRRMAVLNQA